MIKTILIDDEMHCLKTLELSLKKHCPEIKILQCCSNSTDGLKSIQQLNPDLVFLDIEMPIMNAFQLLEKLDQINFDIIFTTAYDQYAISAFKVNAVDYLLKPIEDEELVKAVEKVNERKNISEDQIEFILEQLQKKVEGNQKRIPIPSSGGLSFVDVMDIIYCRAESNYTFIFFTGNKKKVIAKTLKSFEELLPKKYFFRPHQSYIVNLHHVETYVRSHGGYLVMSNKEKVAISRNKKDAFLKQF